MAGLAAYLPLGHTPRRLKEASKQQQEQEQEKAQAQEQEQVKTQSFAVRGPQEETIDPGTLRGFCVISLHYPNFNIKTTSGMTQQPLQKVDLALSNRRRAQTI